MFGNPQMKHVVFNQALNHKSGDIVALLHGVRVGPIHTGGHGMQRSMRHKQMGPVDVNGGVHTARKQHQRKNIRICTRIARPTSCVDWA